MPTTDELRERFEYEDVWGQAKVARDAITEIEARDREIQTWKDTVRDRTYELSQAKKEAAELRDDPYAWYESAQRVNARLRERAEIAEEHAEKLAEALDTWWGGKCPFGWSEKEHRNAPYVNTQGSHERGLVDAFVAYRESRNEDNSPQVSADRDTKVAPEATITQEETDE